MITQQVAVELAREYLGRNGRPSGELRFFTDTSNIFGIDYNDVLLLETGAYLIRGHEREGRFGLDDEIKHWVKKAIDLETGRRKVIKLTFFEKFELSLGAFRYECFRSPKKEARILDLVRGNPSFMQGISCLDEAGNNVRVIDFIPGPTLNAHVDDLRQPHEEYFHNTLPGLMKLLRPVLAGLSFLHQNGEKHGDVRRDHLIYSKEGHLSWIDFDYNYQHGENIAGLDLVGLGNILAFVIGGGDQTLQQLQASRPDVLAALNPGDMNVVFSNRLMNLKKLFPYLPDRLNNILMHFAGAAEVFYYSVEELLDDFDKAGDDLF
ncbi:MAG: hypothetical protein V1816_18900 [Pseudomonadota bacterium]